MVQPSTVAVVCVCCNTDVPSDYSCVVCGRCVCMRCDDVREPLPYKCEDCRADGL